MRFVIYGRDTCPVCDNAMAFMEVKGLKDMVEYVDLDATEGSLEAIKKDGFTTIPAVYFAEDGAENWTVLGGYTDLQKFVKEKGL